MNRRELQIERDRLQLMLGDFDREEGGQQGELDRVFSEDRKRHLISRIAYMDGKIGHNLPAAATSLPPRSGN